MCLVPVLPLLPGLRLVPLQERERGHSMMAVAGVDLGRMGVEHSRLPQEVGEQV